MVNIKNQIVTISALLAIFGTVFLFVNFHYARKIESLQEDKRICLKENKELQSKIDECVRGSNQKDQSEDIYKNKVFDNEELVKVYINYSDSSSNQEAAVKLMKTLSKYGIKAISEHRDEYKHRYMGKIIYYDEKSLEKALELKKILPDLMKYKVVKYTLPPRTVSVPKATVYVPKENWAEGNERTEIKKAEHVLRVYLD